MTRSRAVMLSLATVTAITAACAWVQREPLPPAPPVAAVRAPSLMAAGGHGEDSAGAPAALPDSGRPVDAIEQALFQSGPLRGTHLPEWGAARDGRLVPDRRLRDRFDHYLLGLGDATVDELTALVRAHAVRDLGPATAADVLGVWARYLQLQQHAFQHVGRPGDVASITVALQERVQVRQALLGLHWAQAFYAEEEAALRSDLERARTGAPPPEDPVKALLVPAAGTDPVTLHRDRVARFGEARAERLRALDEEDARWNQRLAAARAVQARLLADAALSPSQRAEALNRWLGDAFPDASERRRIDALLGV